MTLPLRDVRFTGAHITCIKFGNATGLRRMDLLLPGILVGSLGNAIGTYAGFLMVGWLQ
jgi:uncharacterized membrane protein